MVLKVGRKGWVDPYKMYVINKGGSAEFPPAVPRLLYNSRRHLGHPSTEIITTQKRKARPASPLQVFSVAGGHFLEFKVGRPRSEARFPRLKHRRWQFLPGVCAAVRLHAFYSALLEAVFADP